MNHTPEGSTDYATRSLETRLRRIEYILAGSYEKPERDLLLTTRDHSIKFQISELEMDLIRLMNKSRTVKDILDLHLRFPEIFKGPHSAQISSSLTASEKASAILSNAPDFHSASSQLTAILDTHVPDTTISAGLISLLPRIQKAEVVQHLQAAKIAQLRMRTALILEQWFLIGIEGVNDCLAEWDGLTFTMNKNMTQILRRADQQSL
ncbi:hypothetical protein EDC01DRAFT_656011 [Geopyxis carbonaria]|nr:hypothetical protein EDC01DRAFT_656011 [Geopyxis carbonaria]